MAQQTVFYSWQSWTDAGANRNFIQDCLERAIKEIQKDGSLKLDPVIDRDTQGVHGATDIANTIFKKVENADVFVADVSFVQGQDQKRQTPNPNVMIELGFALSNLSEGKVMCVLNIATGRVEDLPFDIRGRAIATYDLKPKTLLADEIEWQTLRGEQRKQFVGKLKHSLVSILSAADPVFTKFVNEAIAELIRVIIFGSEVEDRPLNPGGAIMKATLEDVGRRLREIACKDEANHWNAVARLNEVASAIEEATICSEVLTRGNYGEFLGLVKSAVELASSLKSEWLEGRPLENLSDVHNRLFEMRRQLDALVSRLPAQLERTGDLEEANETANSIGFDLCRFGQFDLDRIQPGIAARISEIGRNLHLVGVSPEYDSGTRRGILKTLENLNRFATEFDSLVEGLPKPR